jgi:hypothetical protein
MMHGHTILSQTLYSSLKKESVYSLKGLKLVNFLMDLVLVF